MTFLQKMEQLSQWVDEMESESCDVMRAMDLYKKVIVLAKSLTQDLTKKDPILRLLDEDNQMIQTDLNTIYPTI
jgi:exonuclease VII small subunit